MKTYPETKTTGLDWLPEIPAHWEVKKLKNIADFVSRGNSPEYVEESNIKIINQACISPYGLRMEKIKYQSETDISGWKGFLRRNDVLINSTGTGTLGRVGIFEETESGFIADGHVTIVRDSKKRFEPKFLFLFLATKQDWITAEAAEGATNQIELSRDKFRSLKIPLPPLPEQRAIVEYLESKGREIESYIAVKTALLERLREWQAARIAELVTKGLDPNAPMKYSGLDWLGDIPAHWEVKKSKYLYRDVNERSETGDEELLSVSHITGVTPRSEKNVTMFMAESYVGHKLCRPNDLVINSMWAWMGALGISSYKGIVSSAYGVYRPITDSLIPAYTNYLLRLSSYALEFELRSKGIWSSRLLLNPAAFGSVPIIVPPLCEQAAIVSQIESDVAIVNAARERATQEIGLARELWASLVAEVVTGKRDVRSD